MIGLILLILYHKLLHIIIARILEVWISAIVKKYYKNYEMYVCIFKTLIDCSQENHNLRAQLDSLQKHRENSVDVLMKLVLRQFLIKLNIDITNTNDSIFKKAQVSNKKNKLIFRKVSLSSDELSVIRRYLMSEKPIEEFGLREHLRAILENFLTEVFSYFYFLIHIIF